MLEVKLFSLQWSFPDPKWREQLINAASNYTLRSGCYHSNKLHSKVTVPPPPESVCIPLPRALIPTFHQHFILLFSTIHTFSQNCTHLPSISHSISEYNTLSSGLLQSWKSVVWSKKTSLPNYNKSTYKTSCHYTCELMCFSTYVYKCVLSVCQTESTTCVKKKAKKRKKNCLAKALIPFWFHLLQWIHFNHEGEARRGEDEGKGVCVYTDMCVCVCGREGERVGEMERKREREYLTYQIIHPALTRHVPGSPLLTQSVHTASLLLRC